MYLFGGYAVVHSLKRTKLYPIDPKVSYLNSKTTKPDVQRVFLAQCKRRMGIKYT